MGSVSAALHHQACPACREKANKYTQDELRLMKTQDVKHIALQAQAEAKVGAAVCGCSIARLCCLGPQPCNASCVQCLGVGHIGIADWEGTLVLLSVQVDRGRCARAADVHALATEAGKVCSANKTFNKI